MAPLLGFGGFIAAGTANDENGRKNLPEPPRMHSPAPEAKEYPPHAVKTYRNPIITRDNPADPHVIRVNGKYYLYPTSHTRGYDVYVSEDLVMWEHRGPVYESVPGGAWAPDVFHDVRGDGRFYLYYTEDHPDRPKSPGNKHIGVAVADGPLGPFSDQGSLASDAIDAHMFQDDDGRYYLYYTNLAGGFKILVQPMRDPLTKEGDAHELIRPTEPWESGSFPVTEAPFVLKRDEVYYLMYSGSPADSPDYAIGYATAQSPTGPFVKHSGNPIAQRSGNVLGPGHHAVVEGPDEKLWMVYHQKFDDGQNYRRFIAIDPLWFDENGEIHAHVSRGTDQPAP